MSVTLDILEIGARGDGVAEHEGQRYFVPFTLPGETVEAEPRDKRGEGIAADLLEVLAPSRHREPPPCAHFTVCGGCALQHWRRDAYTAWKVDLIARALAQRGVDAPRFEPPLVGAPGERRRADFVLRRQGRRVLAGFHERTSPRIVDVGDLRRVPGRPSAACWSRCGRRLPSILPDGAAADAMVNETDSGLDLLLRPHKRLDLSLERREALVALAERADLARLSWGDRASAEPVVVAPHAASAVWRGARRAAAGRLPAGDQARRAGDARRGRANGPAMPRGWPISLPAWVRCRSAGRQGRAVRERQAGGCGGRSRRRAGWAGGLTVERRDLFRNPLTAAELDGFDAVLLDPPRAGAAAQSAELARSKVPRVVYASCDPGSFARDARTLQDGGYRLEKLLPIDQFLWSAACRADCAVRPRAAKVGKTSS